MTILEHYRNFERALWVLPTHQLARMRYVEEQGRRFMSFRFRRALERAGTAR